MAATNGKPTDEIISVEDIKVSPRGRQKVIDSALADLLSKVKPGQAIALRGTFGNVPADKRPQVSQVIRKHWAHVRTDACRIAFTPEGVPQVLIKS